MPRWLSLQKLLETFRKSFDDRLAVDNRAHGACLRCAGITLRICFAGWGTVILQLCHSVFRRRCVRKIGAQDRRLQAGKEGCDVNRLRTLGRYDLEPDI